MVKQAETVDCLRRPWYGGAARLARHLQLSWAWAVDFSRDTPYAGGMPKLKYRTRLPRPDDPDILKRIYEATLAGHPLTTAAELAGIEQSTASKWFAKGLEQIEVDEGGSHIAFVQTVRRAEAEMVERMLGTINVAAFMNWQPAMTLLERRLPRHFGRQQHQTVEQRTLTVNVDLTAMPPSVQRSVLAEQLRRLPEGIDDN